MPFPRNAPLLLVPLLLLAGCSLLPGNRPREDDQRGASTAAVDERRAQYTLDVRAPRALRGLLQDNLDLARFRDAPADQGLTGEELDRLVAAAPKQAADLLRTEGHFDARVTVRRETPPGERQKVVVEVEPGPRSTVTEVALDVQGELRQRADRGDGEAAGLLAALRDGWGLKAGEPFRQGAWSGAKTAALAQLHAGGYPAATWLSTEARVTSAQQQVRLQAQAQSGPLFHLGPLRVEGLQRYDESSVRNLTAFSPGDPYKEQTLLDFQDRLRRSDLFEGAVAEIDPDPAKAAAAPVTVRVQEQRLQKLTLGVGLNTDTGVRVTADHVHRKPFGLKWVARNKLEVGPQRKLWEFDNRSHPLPGLQRNLLAGNVERWSGTDEERFSWRLRAGREQERTRILRQAYVELNHSRVRTPQGDVRQAQSLSGHFDWTRRHVDSLLLPTRGTVTTVQTAAGYARSTTADSGPFGRLYARQLWFRPFATDWHARLRLELGQVIAAHAVGVPDPLLFRAGGEESVRGYAYRSLGPVIDGAVSSGRSLMTASAEVARPLSPRFPQIWGAAFVDAGNAAERFSDLHPVVGVGVGLRYRSPAGPLRVDVAYGVDARKLRLHLSAGTTF